MGTLFIGEFSISYTQKGKRITWVIRARDKRTVAQGVSDESFAWYEMLHALSRAFNAAKPD